MKLHYMGKYDLNPESLPHNDHQPGAVKFKEPKDSKTMSMLANGLSLAVFILLLLLLFLRYGITALHLSNMVIAFILAFIVIFPHEWLHAICFKEDVYLYNNLKQGMVFVVGTETMTKARFVFLSLLPNVIFGVIPYALAMIFPQLMFLGFFGALAVSMGAGDYINAFNALTQMPKGARTYLYQFNSFWYIPS